MIRKTTHIINTQKKIKGSEMYLKLEPTLHILSNGIKKRKFPKLKFSLNTERHSRSGNQGY